jgi:hypothetical protein
MPKYIPSTSQMLINPSSNLNLGQYLLVSAPWKVNTILLLVQLMLFYEIFHIPHTGFMDWDLTYLVAHMG